jgi:hypothetical protein
LCSTIIPPRLFPLVPKRSFAWRARFFERRYDSAPRVVLINRSFARRYWPSENSIGKRFSIDVVCVPSHPCEIVGIVGDMRSRGLQLDPEPEVHVPLEQNWWGTMTLVIRTPSAPLDALPDVRQAVWAVDKNLPLSTVRSMEDVISGDPSQLDSLPP